MRNAYLQDIKQTKRTINILDFGSLAVHVGLTMIGMIIVTRVNGKSMKIKYLKNIVDTQKI